MYHKIFILFPFHFVRYSGEKSYWCPWRILCLFKFEFASLLWQPRNLFFSMLLVERNLKLCIMNNFGQFTSFHIFCSTFFSPRSAPCLWSVTSFDWLSLVGFAFLTFHVFVFFFLVFVDVTFLLLVFFFLYL